MSRNLSSTYYPFLKGKILKPSEQVLLFTELFNQTLVKYAEDFNDVSARLVTRAQRRHHGRKLNVNSVNRQLGTVCQRRVETFFSILNILPSPGCYYTGMTSSSPHDQSLIWLLVYQQSIPILWKCKCITFYSNPNLILSRKYFHIKKIIINWIGRCQVTFLKFSGCLCLC